MKIITEKIGTVNSSLLCYGNCCKFVNELHPGFWMRIPTNSKDVRIVKNDGVLPFEQTNKYVNLESGTVIAVPFKLQVIPVDAEVKILG